MNLYHSKNCYNTFLDIGLESTILEKYFFRTKWLVTYKYIFCLSNLNMKL